MNYLTRMQALRWGLLSLTASASLSGCIFTSPTGGENGIAEFAYDEGLFGCLFGCDADAPMAANANTYLTVTNSEELPPYVATSSDETVLEFIQDSGTSDASIRLVSHASGNAVLILSQTDGREIDRLSIFVNDVDRLEMGSPEIRNRYMIMVGGHDSIHIDLFDANGDALKGFGGVDYEATDGIVAEQVTLTSALEDAIAQAFIGSTREMVSIDAFAVSQGALRVSAPSGATLTIPVEVVDASAVGQVTIENQTAEPGSSITLYAQAFAGDAEEIHDPECAWTVTGDATVAGMGRDSITLSSDTATSAQVTCVIGDAVGSGTATFEEYMP
jgi:hypothetical protein